MRTRRQNKVGYGDKMRWETEIWRETCVTCVLISSSTLQTSCTSCLGSGITHAWAHDHAYYTPVQGSNSRHPSDHRSEANVNCPPENISGAT